MSRLRLVYQIVFAILGIVFATSFVLTSYSLSVQRNLITSQLEKKGQVLSQLLSRSVMNHLLSYDFYTIKLLFDPVERDADVVSVSLIGPDNYVKMDSDLTKLGDPSPYNIDEMAFENGNTIRRDEYSEGVFQYVYLSPVEIDHNRVGLIEVVLSDTESVLLINEFERRMLILTAIVLVLGVIAAYFMSRQISNPVIELTEKMLSFSISLDRQHHRRPQGNEIETLAQTFHAMMDQIEHSIAVRVKTEKMAVLGHLSSMLAHEVKNPLEPIKGSAEMLNITHPGDEVVTKYTRIIQSEVSELISFLDSFLDVARSNELKTEPFDINTAIRDVLVLLEYTAKKENVSLNLNLDEDIPLVRGDIGMIKQVLLNVLLNGIQAKSGEYGYILVTTRYRDGFVETTTTDYGKGIAPDLVKTVFQPFFSTKQGGSGIGLSTSKRIINLHHGQIEITSSEGKWTTVRILLPGEVD